MPNCIFLLAAVPLRKQLRQEVTVPTAVAKTRVAVSETRPLFEKRILEERRQVTQTHVNGDWFVLLDAGLKESGIFIEPILNFVGLQQLHMSKLSSFHDTLLNICCVFTGCTVHRWQCIFAVAHGTLNSAVCCRVKQHGPLNHSFSPLQPHRAF